MGWGFLETDEEEEAAERAEQARNGELGYDAWMNANFSGRPAPIDPNSLGSNLPEFDKRAGMQVGGTRSPWYNMMREQQRLDQTRSMNQMAGSVNGQLAAARSGMQMRGGGSGGTAAALARDALRSGAMGQQEILNKGASDVYALGADDYKSQLGQRNNDLNVWAQLASREQSEKNKLRIANQDAQTRQWAAMTEAWGKMND